MLAALALFLAPLGAPVTLSTVVDYHFVDQNGIGWVRQEGTVTVTLTFAGERGTLRVAGKGELRDAVLQTPGPTPGSDLKVDRHEYDIDEHHELVEVQRTGKTIAFGFDLEGKRISGSCAPVVVPGIRRKTLKECSFTGFGWHSAVPLPALHHPLIFDRPSKRRLQNVLTGSTRQGDGVRRVTEK